MTFNEGMMSLEIGLIYGVVALGIYFTFRIIDFPDLTCDGSFVLGAVLSAVFLKTGYTPWVAVGGALLGGCVAGLATGILTTHFKVAELLSGILVAFMLYSVNLHIMGGIPNLALIGFETLFTQTSGLALLGGISVALCALGSYALLTDFGLSLRSIGQNKRLAQNGGIHVQSRMITGLMIGNGLIALGGALFSHHQGFADVGSGLGTVIIGLASVMIGERVFPSRSIVIQMISCVFGSILYRFLVALALHSEVLGLESQDLNLLTGVMIVGIMVLPRKRLC